jgi:hypothetical protein
MLFSLCIDKGKEDVNWGGLSLYMESRHAPHERPQFQLLLAEFGGKGDR